MSTRALARDCDQELCPMWDGEGCPCAVFRLDRDHLPERGVFSIEVPEDPAE